MEAQIDTLAIALCEWVVGIFQIYIFMLLQGAGAGSNHLLLKT